MVTRQFLWHLTQVASDPSRPTGDGCGLEPAVRAPESEPDQALQHASATGPPAINLATVGPLRAAVWEVLPEEGGLRGRVVSALLEVTPLRSTPANTVGLSPVTGYPIRSAPSTCASLVHTKDAHELTHLPGNNILCAVKE